MQQKKEELLESEFYTRTLCALTMSPFGSISIIFVFENFFNLIFFKFKI